ncbi:MAG: TlpA family protein disulfide reductase [Planctomycetaceae bacterium]|jgi:thiol-disulfide isomerase/thioredoxin|nr:TlpA family protein disulfide reductase [Planctomycetaceae bacterium]
MKHLTVIIFTAILLIILSSSCRKTETQPEIQDGLTNVDEDTIDINKIGIDIKLYGKTIDGKDFNWDSLRGKYVLIQFTSTYCVPCLEEIPNLRQAYQQYHTKGFEIVSVYLLDRIDITKKFVENEQLPWLIISENLTAKFKQTPHFIKYNINSVPKMLLVNKEGKIIDTNARGQKLQTLLKKLLDGKES